MEAGLCDCEGEPAYTIYDPVLGGEKLLKYFKRFAGAKTLQKRINLISNHSIRFRCRFSLTQKFHPKISHQLNSMISDMGKKGKDTEAKT